MTAQRRVEIVVLDNIRPDAPRAGHWKSWLRGNADAVVEHRGNVQLGALQQSFAPMHATGQFLLFLNDDVEVLDATGSTRCWSTPERPEVGAVGPLLLYPGGKVQHAGHVPRRRRRPPRLPLLAVRRARPVRPRTHPAQRDLGHRRLPDDAARRVRPSRRLRRAARRHQQRPRLLPARARSRAAA